MELCFRSSWDKYQLALLNSAMIRNSIRILLLIALFSLPALAEPFSLTPGASGQTTFKDKETPVTFDIPSGFSLSGVSASGSGYNALFRHSSLPLEIRFTKGEESFSKDTLDEKSLQSWEASYMNSRKADLNGKAPQVQVQPSQVAQAAKADAMILSNFPVTSDAPFEYEQSLAAYVLPKQVYRLSFLYPKPGKDGVTTKDVLTMVQSVTGSLHVK